MAAKVYIRLAINQAKMAQL